METNPLARWRGLGGGLRRLHHRALGDRDRISGALHERTRVPFIGLLAIYFIFLSLRLRPQALPFTNDRAALCRRLSHKIRNVEVKRSRAEGLSGYANEVAMGDPTRFSLDSASEHP